MKRLVLVLIAVLMVTVLPGFTAPQDVKAYVDRGLAALEAGRFDQALQDFNRALNLKPNDASLYDFRGVAYRGKGLDDQAMKDFNQALQLDPKYAKAYRNRAMVYYDNSEFDKALGDLEKAQTLGYQVDQDFLRLVRRKAAEKK
jgi:Flp pilus assembly protein TadD